MKKRMLQTCIALVPLLAASTTLAATAPGLGTCDARSPAAAESSECLKVAIRVAPEGLQPAVMRDTPTTAPKADLRQPEHVQLPDPGGWATLLAGLLGAFAIARRRVS